MTTVALRGPRRQRLVEQPQAPTVWHIATDVSINPAVMTYMRKRNLRPNADGTVRLCKTVDSKRTTGSRYGHELAWKDGKRIEAPDYEPTEACGNGLHFCATRYECGRVVGGRAVCLVVDVDLRSAVCVHGDKIKAKWCKVVGEGDENDFMRSEWE